MSWWEFLIEENPIQKIRELEEEKSDLLLQNKLLKARVATLNRMVEELEKKLK